MATNPFATPTAPVAANTPVATNTPVAANTAVPVEAATDEKKNRKTPAKQLTGEQIREVIQRATVNKETPQQIADAMGLVRNQTYRTIKTYKDRINTEMAEEGTTDERKGKLQEALDLIPARNFGEGGAGRTSKLNSTLDDLLAGL